MAQLGVVVAPASVDFSSGGQKESVSVSTGDLLYSSVRCPGYLTRCEDL